MRSAAGAVTLFRLLIEASVPSSPWSARERCDMLAPLELQNRVDARGAIAQLGFTSSNEG
jgi:hypothetical protein